MWFWFDKYILLELDLCHSRIGTPENNGVLETTGENPFTKGHADTRNFATRRRMKRFESKAISDHYNNRGSRINFVQLELPADLRQ